MRRRRAFMPHHGTSLHLHALILHGMMNKMLTAIENIYPNSQDAEQRASLSFEYEIRRHRDTLTHTLHIQLRAYLNLP